MSSWGEQDGGGKLEDRGVGPGVVNRNIGWSRGPGRATACGKVQSQPFRNFLAMSTVPSSLSSAESCETTPSIRLSPSALLPSKSAASDRSSGCPCPLGAAKPWAVGTVQLRDCPAACDAYGSATSDGLALLPSLWTTSSSLCSIYHNDTLVQPPLSNQTTVRWALYSEPSSPREQWPFSDAQLRPRRPASGSKFAIFGRELDEHSLLLDMGIWCVPPLRITLIS